MGSDLLTSAVGPADVIIDQVKALTVDPSTGLRWGPRVSGPTCQLHSVADGWDRLAFLKSPPGFVFPATASEMLVDFS